MIYWKIQNYVQCVKRVTGVISAADKQNHPHKPEGKNE